MPGLLGLVTGMPRERAQATVRRMVRAVSHEAFYRTGTWSDVDLGVYVGWTALVGSFADGMPLRNERGDAVLVFSGEEYPDEGTPRRLEERGHSVEMTGPSYLVHVYEEDGAFPASLNGRFHGLVANLARGTATLFNDRFGIHRLYYYESAEGLYFAAEAKAILAVCPQLREAEPRSLGEFVACGCVLENRTLFKGIRVLPPASAWELRSGSLVRKTTYFQPREWEEQEVLPPERFYQEVREVFSRNLPRYFPAREQIGMSLTGGLDTRMIMAWQNRPPGELPCYSFGGMFRDCQDVRLARLVAGACGQPHEVIPVGREFLSKFGHYAERAVYLTDGCTSVRHAPDLYANELARAVAPTRMTGNYGGEVLRRVRAFKPEPLMAGVFDTEFSGLVDAATKTYSRVVEGHPLSFALFRQTPWHHYGLLALEQTQLSLRSPYLDNDFVRVLYRAPASAVTSNDLCLRLIVDGHSALDRIRTDRGLGGHAGRLRSAATRQWLEFTFKAEYAYDYGMPQWLARIDNLLSPLRVERALLGRHKFCHFRVWYRGALSEYVREILLDRRALSRPYLQRATIEPMVQRHLDGNGNYTLELHKLLTLELIHRVFLDAGSGAQPTPQPLTETASAGRPIDGNTNR